ncbi:hypothetical protein L6Q96_08695 [Candidatus Binatia bacterium]|nr:hypothetical protein [Candidatus Binatia bacterium]
MNGRWVGGAAMLGVAVVCGFAPAALGAMTTCRMDFSLEGWSAFYESASGRGTITCDNGQSARVDIRAKGGGLTVGKMNVVDGHGRFSQVSDIRDLFGSYATMEADAGMVKSASAQVVTKGTVSLALSGKGQGIELGVSFGEFVIEKAGTERKK